MASSMALLLLLLAAVASTTAQMHEREPLVEHVEPASPTSAELLLAAVAAITAKLQREPHVVESASTTSELDDVEPADEGGYRTYIVMLDPPEGGQDVDADAARAWHLTFLPSSTTAQGKQRLLYSYRTVFTGFAARLTEEELKELSKKPGFVRSFEDIIYRAQRTLTPTSFVDLPNHMGESSDNNGPGAGGYMFD